MNENDNMFSFILKKTLLNLDPYYKFKILNIALLYSHIQENLIYQKVETEEFTEKKFKRI